MDDFFGIIFLQMFAAGCWAEECSQGVLAKRETFNASAGGSLSLSCVVQHCGGDWTSNWIWKNSSNDQLRVVSNSGRHHITSETLSANQTRKLLTIQRLRKTDDGYYGCRVLWGQGQSDQGHLMFVNVTAGVLSQRSVLHRVMVCASACLCLLIFLGLARCLSSGTKSHPPPRAQFTHAAAEYSEQLVPNPPPRCPIPHKHATSSNRVPYKSQQKTEVVYADISQNALSQQAVTSEPAQSTIYSSVRFS
ncbi:uncharacterized protein ACBR49_004265 isoform 1-T1 [Aulostomus maculatus]